MGEGTVGCSPSLDVAGWAVLESTLFILGGAAAGYDYPSLTSASVIPAFMKRENTVMWAVPQLEWLGG
jgi:hypothetical protein